MGSNESTAWYHYLGLLLSCRKALTELESVAGWGETKLRTKMRKKREERVVKKRKKRKKKVRMEF